MWRRENTMEVTRNAFIYQSVISFFLTQFIHNLYCNMLWTWSFTSQCFKVKLCFAPETMTLWMSCYFSLLTQHFSFCILLCLLWCGTSQKPELWRVPNAVQSVRSWSTGFVGWKLFTVSSHWVKCVTLFVTSSGWNSNFPLSFTWQQQTLVRQGLILGSQLT